MPQVSLYVEDELMDELRSGAAQEGVSLSKHVARRLRDGKASYQGRCDTPSGLPERYFDRLYGCIDDDTFERPAQPGLELDSPRLALP